MGLAPRVPKGEGPEANGAGSWVGPLVDGHGGEKVLVGVKIDGGAPRNLGVVLALAPLPKKDVDENMVGTAK